jgi:hypothetical protein
MSDTSYDPPDGPDPADVADADAYEELTRNDSTTINSDQMAVGDALGIPEPTDLEDETGVEDHDRLTPPQEMSTLVVDKFPFGNPGMPIPDKPHGLSVYESWQATSVTSPWAPFRSELDWNVARWVKMCGPTSTAVTELLAIPGVGISH